MCDFIICGIDVGVGIGKGGEGEGFLLLDFSVILLCVLR